jgi:hypothetical protein
LCYLLKLRCFDVVSVFHPFFPFFSQVGGANAIPMLITRGSS